jgi:signal transduction histidine kinase
MMMSSVRGWSRVRSVHTEGPSPCLLFEAARDEAGHLIRFHYAGGNAAAEARASAHEGGAARWAQALAGDLERAACARVIETGEPYTTELCCPLGAQERWWHATVVRQGDGFALWVRDVTEARQEERRAWEALTRAQDHEEHLRAEAECRERFIGILGHDLRSPLNAISLSAKALARYGPLMPTQEGLRLRILASAERMSKMISDLLDLTRARHSGGFQLSLAPTNLSAVCQRVLEELEAAYPDRRLAYEEAQPLEGVWDAARLEQVVSNLVANALEHGGTEVPVRVRSCQRGELLALEVHNPGAPIPAERLATLFEPFHSTPGSEVRTRRSGLGLGLYIVREIIQAHGGQVTVRSSEAEGTTFTVLLPRDSRGAGSCHPGQEPHRPEPESREPRSA